MKIENLKAGYHKNIIVKDMSLDIHEGEVISLIGPNGGGKSTLLKSISGQIKLLGGSVFIGRDELKHIPLKELSKRMSIVTTERIKPQHMTCRDVVLSGRLPYSDSFGVFSDEDFSAAAGAMDLMKIAELSDKPYDALSDGQKQRTLIGRAICQDPEYLIMDEPTSYLDIRYKLELMDVITRLSGEGKTIIMSLHEPQLALQISDRILLVKRDGSCVYLKPEEVLDSGLIKELYGLTDEMYERVKRQLENDNDEGLPKGENKVEECKAETKSDCDISGTDQGTVQKVSKPSTRHSSYFLNKECEYYPCHELSEEKFSCMFCYCPLYDMDDCGGEYTYTEKGAKNCKNCVFPHDRDNYAKVIKKLKEKMYKKEI